MRHATDIHRLKEFIRMDNRIDNERHDAMKQATDGVCQRTRKQDAAHGYIFDYGGTLDTGGCHWGKVLWQAYCRNNAGVDEESFRKAYVFGERTLGEGTVIRPDYTFRMTLDAKLRLELEYLKENGHISTGSNDLDRLRAALLDDAYGVAARETLKSRKVLETIGKTCPMVLVSNFYGNINTVLGEFGLDKLFTEVIESATVGIRKPDPRIFSIGVEALGMAPCNVTVVGDSFTNDIIPAIQAGCHTVWIKGEGWTDKTYDETLPDAVITDIRQLTE